MDHPIFRPFGKPNPGIFPAPDFPLCKVDNRRGAEAAARFEMAIPLSFP